MMIIIINYSGLSWLKISYKAYILVIFVMNGFYIERYNSTHKDETCVHSCYFIIIPSYKYSEVSIYLKSHIKALLAHHN